MNHPSSGAPRPDDETRALLSALTDGDAQALQRGCELWRDEAGAREAWHVYHVIGDVMRSDELAPRPGRDAAFLSALRVRLQAEPVVVAPAPAAPVRSARARQRWLMPVAAAAGFVAVAGVLVVVRMQEAPAGGPQLASVPAPAAAPGLRLADTQAQAPSTLVIDGRLIRDARLDAYLEAHRQAAFGPAAAVPGGAPRSLEVSRSPAAPTPAPVAR